MHFVLNFQSPHAAMVMHTHQVMHHVNRSTLNDELLTFETVSRTLDLPLQALVFGKTWYSQSSTEGHRDKQVRPTRAFFLRSRVEIFQVPLLFLFAPDCEASKPHLFYPGNQAAAVTVLSVTSTGSGVPEFRLVGTVFGITSFDGQPSCATSCTERRRDAIRREDQMTLYLRLAQAGNGKQS
jgi:hypothetical protein